MHCKIVNKSTFNGEKLALIQGRRSVTCCVLQRAEPNKPLIRHWTFHMDYLSGEKDCLCRCERSLNCQTARSHKLHIELLILTNWIAHEFHKLPLRVNSCNRTFMQESPLTDKMVYKSPSAFMFYRSQDVSDSLLNWSNRLTDGSTRAHITTL